MYTCIAKNTYGEVESTGKLIVRSKFRKLSCMSVVEVYFFIKTF